MKLIKTILLLLSICGISCSKNEKIYFYSLDKSQCITIVNSGAYRFIINGEFNSIPDSNYIKLRVSDIDPIRDVTFICWKDEKYEWSVVGHLATVEESKLDTSRFNFSTKLPLDNRRIPTQIKFSNENCAVFDFHTMKLVPNKGAIVQIK